MVQAGPPSVADTSPRSHSRGVYGFTCVFSYIHKESVLYQNWRLQNLCTVYR